MTSSPTPDMATLATDRHQFDFRFGNHPSRIAIVSLGRAILQVKNNLPESTDRIRVFQVMDLAVQVLKAVDKRAENLLDICAFVGPYVPRIAGAFAFHKCKDLLLLAVEMCKRIFVARINDSHAWPSFALVSFAPSFLAGDGRPAPRLPVCRVQREGALSFPRCIRQSNRSQSG